MKSKKAFTLIELVSVLVILAILALIVTPLVLNIIRKARIAADKRSIDAYGRSIELAIADYLLENGTFPTSIEELQVEYSGDRVVCSNSGINEDGTIYLTDCTVNSRAVTGYTYGKGESEGNNSEYEIGDVITYNGVNYYVLEDSDVTETSVALLKAEPITSEEIRPYISSTEVASRVYMSETYVKMAYVSYEKCASSGNRWLCPTDYNLSDIKEVVDIWKTTYARGAIDARLLTADYLPNLGYELYDNGSVAFWQKTENSPNWIYNSNYRYWTMDSYGDSNSVFYVVENGDISSNDVDSFPGLNIRPVITINKSALN